MEWICRECGNEVVADEPLLVSSIGWTLLDGDTGVCAICTHRHVRETADALRANAARTRERTKEAIAMTRALLRPSR